MNKFFQKTILYRVCSLPLTNWWLKNWYAGMYLFFIDMKNKQVKKKLSTTTFSKQGQFWWGDEVDQDPVQLNLGWTTPGCAILSQIGHESPKDKKKEVIQNEINQNRTMRFPSYSEHDSADMIWIFFFERQCMSMNALGWHISKLVPVGMLLSTGIS